MFENRSRALADESTRAVARIAEANLGLERGGALLTGAVEGGLWNLSRMAEAIQRGVEQMEQGAARGQDLQGGTPREERGDKVSGLRQQMLAVVQHQ